VLSQGSFRGFQGESIQGTSSTPSRDILGLIILVDTEASTAAADVNADGTN